MRLMSDKLVESEFGLVTNVGIWSKHIHPLPLPSRVSLARPLIYFGVLEKIKGGSAPRVSIVQYTQIDSRMV